MKFRKLRIAWSVAWGVVAVLLIALTIRSYYRRDVVAGVIFSHEVAIESVDGHIAFLAYYLNPAYSATPFGLSSYGPKSTNWATRLNDQWLLRDWALLCLFVFVAITPWIRIKERTGWSFSLRTLLIATTLVAVALGLIVWAARK